MPSLTAAAFLAMAASCAPSVPSQDADVYYLKLLAIAKVESDLGSLVVHDNNTKREYSPADRGEAIDLATRLRQAGHNIDAGIMQVNSANWEGLNISLEQTFDVCQNIRAGAQELSSYSVYNTGSRVRGFLNGYVEKVVRAKYSVIDANLSDQSPASGPSLASLQQSDWDTFLRGIGCHLDAAGHARCIGGASTERGHQVVELPQVLSHVL